MGDQGAGKGWLRHNVAPLLALVTVIGTFTLFGLSFLLKVDGANEKVLFMVLGALSSIATTVIGFYFGGSEARGHQKVVTRKAEGKEPRG
jgi:hypothetical protein